MLHKLYFFNIQYCQNDQISFYALKRNHFHSGLQSKVLYRLQCPIHRGFLIFYFLHNMCATTQNGRTMIYKLCHHNDSRSALCSLTYSWSILVVRSLCNILNLCNLNNDLHEKLLFILATKSLTSTLVPLLSQSA